MSDIITAVIYNDPALDSIRTQVSGKNDQIPYLLLPVKIETRFMKVDRPLVSRDPFPFVIKDLAWLEDYMNFDPRVLPPHEVLGRVNKISEKLNEINEISAGIKQITADDKQTILQFVSNVSKQNKALTTNLSKVKVGEEGSIKKLVASRTSLNGTLKTLTSSIENLPASKYSLVSPTDDFISSFRSISKAMDKIGSKDLGSSDRKEKRRLFQFLDQQIQTVKSGLKELQQKMAVNMTPQANELEQIESLTRAFDDLLEKSGKNIRHLKSNYKITEYNHQLSDLKAKYKGIQVHIQNVITPKILMMHDLRRSDARFVLVQVLKTRSYLKRLNEKVFGKYEDIRSTRKKVYEKLYELREDVHKVIEGTDEEIDALKQAWDETDIELEKFTERVARFKTTDSKEKAGVTRTITHINEEYRKDLAGLKSTSKSAFPRLNNTLLEKSAITYQNAIQRIKELNEAISGSPEKLSEVLPEVEKFSQSFAVSSRDLHVLPRKALEELQLASRQLEANISKVSRQDSRNLRSAHREPILSEHAASAITSIVNDQVADGLDRKDRFYDEQRSPIVFATRTITRDELWVRFYPDDIAIHTHEEALTTAEVEDGKAYWYEIWAAGEDYDLKLAAWRAISTGYGSQRAAWIVKTMQPQATNTEITNTLLGKSKSLNQVNSKLQEIDTILTKTTDSRDVFEILGQAYPLLNTIDEQLKRIEKDNSTLLLKTHKFLLKIQSSINRSVRAVNQMTVAERNSVGSRLQILHNFINRYNSIVDKFKTIRKVPSKEIIREATVSTVFPSPATKETSWTVAPHSRIMPDQFAVITMRDGQYRHVKVGKPLPAERLIVGMDPEDFGASTFQYDSDGNLLVDEKIKWLTDFDEAVKKGMAVAINLEEEDVDLGFDKVFVVGVKNTTSEAGKDLLEDLIQNHHYIPEGASFLPVGTPTNNTEAGKSGYRKLEEDEALSFAVERNNEDPIVPTSDPAFPSDAERLAEGLGIDISVLNNLDHKGRTEISEALTMNQALFHGTIGNYMEEGLDTLFTLDNIKHTKAFFNNYVSARGFLPSLRVGTQPYGILPTTAFSKFSITENDSNLPVLTKEDFENHYNIIQDELQVRYDIRLKQLLNLVDVTWTGIRQDKVAFSGNTDPANPQDHFMKMLGLQPASAEFFYRYGLNIAARQGGEDLTINFDSDDPWGPTKVAEAFRNQVLSGYYYNSDHFSDEQNVYSNILDYFNEKYSRISDQFAKTRAFAMRFLQDQSQLLGEFIDNRELSDTIIPAGNPFTGTPEEQLKARAELDFYIDWLVNQNPWDIHAQNKFSEVTDSTLVEAMPSKSVLFLLLRHSVLSAYADTILNILEFEGLTDQETRKKMGMPKHFYQKYASKFTYVTKWTYLFSKIDSLDGVLGYEMDKTNSFYNYMESLSVGSNGFLNRYISPEHPYIFNAYSNHSVHQPFMDELTATRNAITKLKDIPTLRLQKLLSEHIDLCTYRLDAWKLGMVNKRLKNNRATTSAGIYLGAYGWVEDLRKGGVLSPATSIPSGLWKNGDDPVFTDADNLGFIHTPSLNHAITAAILRSGFQANKATGEIENQMAVNLSSERVRTALSLISGIRGGQSIEALLGYQFERGLHERYLHIPLELDEFIYDFREEFPLTLPVDDDLALGESTMSQVVNGLDLLETAQEFIETKGGPPNPGDSLYQSLKAFESDWWSHVNNANISAASDQKKDAMLKEIDRMADAFDALGDLCISESIYQVAKGNHVRSSAIMDKLAKGDVPNDIEIADTPRTGTVVTHKFGMFFETVSGIDHELTESGTTSTPMEGTLLNSAVLAANAVPSGWNAPFTPRALAEPTLNKWAGEIIGDPAKIIVLVEYLVQTGEGEELVEETLATTVSLADLQIQPLDVLHMFGTGPLDGGAELNARIAALVREKITLPVDFEGTADDLKLNIRYTFKDNLTWSEDEYTFYEKAGLIQSLRQLITNSTPIAADDLLIPGQEEVEEDQVRNLQVDELQVRITNLNARLQIVADHLQDFFDTEISLEDAPEHTFTTVQVDSLRSLLKEAAIFAIPGAVPETVVSYGNSPGLSLINSADGVLKAIEKRLAEAAPDLEKGANTSLLNEARVNALREAARKILGKAFVVVPQFKLRNADDLALQINLDETKGLLRSASPFAMEEWSQSSGRVRERVAVFDTLQMWVENFGTELPSKEALQFPFSQDGSGTSIDHWLGVEFPDGYTPSEDKLSLILMNTAELILQPEDPKAGFLIDEWVEIIPNLKETTGITFNYDQPDAKAPNTLLLAVTPKETGSWSWDNLVHTLNDTLELAKNRAVEPEHLEDTVFGQILPALLTEIVPPQLLPEDGDDSSDAEGNPLGMQVVTDFGVNNDTYEPENEDA